MIRPVVVAPHIQLTSRRTIVRSLVSGVALAVIPSLGSASPSESPGAGTASSSTPTPRPRFADKVEQVKLELPKGKKLGSVVGISRAPDGDIFLLHDVAWANPPVPDGEQLAQRVLCPRMVRLEYELPA